MGEVNQMSKEVYETKIRDFIVETFLFGEDNNMKSDDSLLEQGIIDSSGILELVGFMEESFNIKVDDIEITPDNLDTINKITQFLINKSNQVA